MQLSPPKGHTWNIQWKFSSSLGGKKKSLVHYQDCDSLDKYTPNRLLVKNWKQRRRVNEVPQGSG